MLGKGLDHYDKSRSALIPVSARGANQFAFVTDFRYNLGYQTGKERQLGGKKWLNFGSIGLLILFLPCLWKRSSRKCTLHSYGLPRE
ncbi:MAG: hypothetical protein JXA89_10555, partial [Anaerolineae bacterium]|nr:hypothetical protein [Anaerolineae bacterium]